MSSSSSVPIIASSSSMTMSLPSREMCDNNHHRLFQFYLESFFKIPKDISHDIIYCQRALKAHIKVHQMVLDVFQQQPDADPQQKKRILDELEGEIYEINAEQNFLFLRLRRIIDEFMKMLKKNDIPTDPATTNAFVSRELVPLINDPTLEIIPTTVIIRSTEEKLIEKYFEVQNDTKPEPVYENMEIIDLDDDEESKVVEKKFNKTHGNSRFGNRKEHLTNVGGGLTGESLLKNLQGNMATQPSLLKPFNQRMTNDLMTLDVKPNVNKPVKTLGDLYKRKKEEKLISQRMAQELMAVDVKPNIIKPVKTLGDLYQQKKEEKETASIELPVSTNVKMSRMNLRQALKRAQAAVRGPTNASIPAPPPPPPPPPAPVAVTASNDVAVKKSTAGRTRATRAAVAAAAAAAVTTSSSTGTQKSPERSSSSEEGTPERGHTPPHNFWPDEFEETRTKAEEYGQEMFLRLFDLFTPEIHAQLQQRRSKRRRRCVQNNSYHYGRLEHLPASTVNNEADNKKKRKNFLLSPQVKKALPAKRTKRRSADNVSETNSAPPSRSTSSSPDEKRSCNECLKTGSNLEQCEECKLHYHPQCHREDDDVMIIEDPKENLHDLKKCPGCKRKHDKAIKEALLIQRRLQSCAEDLELQLAKEKDRNEILQRTGKSYKIQMNNIFKIVNSIKTETSTTSQSATEIIIDDADEIM